MKTADGGRDGGAENESGPHLVVDVEHSLLNLLVDLLGCVDESLRERERQREKGTGI